MNENRNGIRCGRRPAEAAPCEKTAAQMQRHADDTALRRVTAAAIVLAVTVSVTALCLGATGKFGTSRGFSDASAEAVDAIRENEALAVFLGWAEDDGAVPASVCTDGIWLPDPPESGGMSFWDYVASVFGKLLLP